MDITIRPADAGDRDSVRALYEHKITAEVSYDSDVKADWADSQEAEELYEKIITQDGKIGFLAQTNEDIVGLVVIFKANISVHESQYWKVQSISVAPEYRTKGVGTMLMEHAMAYMKEQGGERVVLEVASDNPAVNFYEKLGFTDLSKLLERKL